MHYSLPSSSSTSSKVRKNKEEVERKKKYQERRGQEKKRKEEETRKQQEAALRLQRQQDFDIEVEERRKEYEERLDQEKKREEEETRKQQEAALRLQRQQDFDIEVEERRLKVLQEQKAHYELQKQEEEQRQQALDGDAKQKRLNELDNQRLLEHSTAKAEISDNKKKIKVVDPSIAMAIVSTSENALTIATTGENTMAIIPTGEISMTDKFESFCVKLNAYYQSELTDSQGSYVLENFDILTEKEADLFGWMSYINEHQARFAQCSIDSLTLFIGCAESNSISFLKSDVNIAKCEEWLLKFRSDTIPSPRPWLRIEDGAPTQGGIAIEDGTPI
jgi:hypothetical protein